MKLRGQGFLLARGAAVALAWLVPELGASTGPLRPALLNQVAVALVFFLHGVSMPAAALRAGTRNLKLHALVQLASFALFPLLGWLGVTLAGAALPADLAHGVLFLCALPSTVSSSVAMTAAARGNVAAAVFNASLSNLIGVVITPLWLGLLLGAAPLGLSFGAAVLELARLLLLPLALGQLARPRLGAFADRHRVAIDRFDRGAILLLVFTSFADSVQRGVWSSHGPSLVLLASAACALLLAAMVLLIELAASALRLPLPDRITAVFCGSKKTLASGVPMARVLFGANPSLGLILLPLLIYHPLQLIVGSWLASRFAAGVGDRAGER
jgi:solute carrier family 10 (sodium/bile acid cotransporter), member 7